MKTSIKKMYTVLFGLTFALLTSILLVSVVGASNIDGGSGGVRRYLTPTSIQVSRGWVSSNDGTSKNEKNNASNVKPENNIVVDNIPTSTPLAGTSSNTVSRPGIDPVMSENNQPYMTATPTPIEPPVFREDGRPHIY